MWGREALEQDTGCRARAREEARPPPLTYVGAMSDKAAKVMNEINVFLDEKVQKKLWQTAKYLDSKKKGLSYNDPERRQINFTQQCAERLLRAEVEFLPEHPGGLGSHPVPEPRLAIHLSICNKLHNFLRSLQTIVIQIMHPQKIHLNLYLCLLF